MKHILTLTTFLFMLPILLMAQVDELSIDELLHVDVAKEAQSIPVSPEEATTGATVNLGILLPYSKYPDYSKEVMQAARMAVDEIMGVTRFGNKELLLIPADDAADAGISAERAQELVDKYMISALIGPTSSNRVMHVAQEVAIPSEMVLIAPDVTADAISRLKDDNWVWRTSPSDKEQTVIAARYAHNELKAKTAGIIYVNNVYGKGLRKAFKENFRKAGGRIVSEMDYSDLVNIESYDYLPDLKAFFEKKPELVYFVTNVKEGAALSQTIADNGLVNEGYQPVFFSCGANKGQDFIETGAPEILEGMYGTVVATPEDETFTKNYVKNFGHAPKFPEVANTYDIIYLLGYAMMSAGKYGPDDIRKHLQEVSRGGEKIGINEFSKAMALIGQGKDIDYDGAAGVIAFDKHGDVGAGAFEIWQIENGKFKTIELRSFE